MAEQRQEAADIRQLQRTRIAALQTVCRSRPIQPEGEPDCAVDQPKRKGRLSDGCLGCEA